MCLLCKMEKFFDIAAIIVSALLYAPAFILLLFALAHSTHVCHFEFGFCVRVCFFRVSRFFSAIISFRSIPFVTEYTLNSDADYNGPVGGRVEIDSLDRVRCKREPLVRVSDAVIVITRLFSVCSWSHNLLHAH